MKATYRLASPDEAEASLTVTLTVRDWRRLLKQLESGNYPSWVLKDTIRELINKADASFSEEGVYDSDR